AIHPDAEEALVSDLDPGLLAQLPFDAVQRILALFEEAARQVPLPGEGILRALTEENAPPVVDDNPGRGRVRVRIGGEAAVRTFETAGGRRDRCRAPGAVSPLVHLAHPATIRGHVSTPRPGIGHRALPDRVARGPSGRAAAKARG